MASFTHVLPVVVLCVFVLRLHGVPLPGTEDESNGIHPLKSLFHPDDGDYWLAGNETAENNSTNGTHKDLYVIKAVVYEIGILVDSNDTDEAGDDPVSDQQVDLTFFPHDSNETHINLGDIPLPVATSVNGQVLTGIAPVHVGAVSDLSQILSTIPISGTVVNITQTNGSSVVLTEKDIDALSKDEAPIDIGDLAKLPAGSPSHPLIPNALDNVVTNLAATGKD